MIKKVRVIFLCFLLLFVIPEIYAQTYCTPAADCSSSDAITNVTFVGINNTSGCVFGAYADYFSSVAPANVTGGTLIPISITAGSGGIAYAILFLSETEN